MHHRKTYRPNLNVSNPALPACTTFVYTLGKKVFELSNHLGNVLTTISDRRISETSGGTLVSFHAQILSSQDYYPFACLAFGEGSVMPGRSFSSEAYRWGFNGKEMDSEGMGGSTYDYGFRIYNAQIAKFLSVDPLLRSFPWNSPYSYAENRPIDGIDLDGKEWSSAQTTDPETGLTTIVNTCKIKIVNKTGIENGSQEMLNLIADMKTEFAKSYYQFDKTTNTLYTAEFEIEFVEKYNKKSDFVLIFYSVRQRRGGTYDAGGTKKIGQTQVNIIKVSLELVLYNDNKTINLLNHIGPNGPARPSVIRSFLHELGHSLGLFHPHDKKNRAQESIREKYLSGEIDDNLMIQSVVNQDRDDPLGSSLELEQIILGTQTIQQQQ